MSDLALSCNPPWHSACPGVRNPLDALYQTVGLVAVEEPLKPQDVSRQRADGVELFSLLRMFLSKLARRDQHAQLHKIAVLEVAKYLPSTITALSCDAGVFDPNM